MLNIVLFGPPGAGKGTQADKLMEHFGLLHISTGEVIRQQIKEGTPLGIRAEKEMDGGKLASDEVVISIIEDFLKHNRNAKGTIFDGFPRTTPQAEAFDKMLEAIGEKVSVMISLDVPEEILIQRLLERGKVSGRADDASEEVIKNRIAVYHKQTAVVKDFYEKQGKYIEINGADGIEPVFNRLVNLLNSLE